MDCSLPGSSIHGILQARILEPVAIPSSRESSQPRNRIHVSYIYRIDKRVVYHWCHLIICNNLEVKCTLKCSFGTAVKYFRALCFLYLKTTYIHLCLDKTQGWGQDLMVFSLLMVSLVVWPVTLVLTWI